MKIALYRDFRVLGIAILCNNSTRGKLWNKRYGFDSRGSAFNNILIMNEALNNDVKSAPEIETLPFDQHQDSRCSNRGIVDITHQPVSQTWDGVRGANTLHV